MKTINLTKGTEAIVDDEDFIILSQYKWYNNKGYACKRWKTKTVWMHHAIYQTGEGLFIDHINGNKLDNRRCNLRVANQSQNMVNRKQWSKSGYKGVSWFTPRSKWRAKARLHGKDKTIGYYDDVKLAAKAYNDFAVMVHGEYAWLNQLDN